MICGDFLVPWYDTACFVTLCIHVCVCVRVRVHACVCARACVCMCVRSVGAVCVLDQEAGVCRDPVPGVWAVVPRGTCPLWGHRQQHQGESGGGSGSCGHAQSSTRRRSGVDEAIARIVHEFWRAWHNIQVVFSLRIVWWCKECVMQEFLSAGHFSLSIFPFFHLHSNQLRNVGV